MEKIRDCLKNKYVISLDLDSTLLDDNKKISDETIKYFQKLTKLGHLIILNSGRPYQGTTRYSKILGITCPVIFSDGGGIAWLDKDYEVSKKILFPMKKEVISALYKENKDNIIGINIVEFNNQYFNDKRAIPEWMFHEGKDIVLHEGEIDEILKEDPITISCSIKKEGYDKFINSLDKYSSEVGYSLWGDFEEYIAFELYKKGINKGSTLLYLVDLLGYSRDNIIAIGDNLNDLGMINVAKYGCAMINSRDEVKKEAKYVTEYDCNNDGVRHFIESIIKE